MQVVERIGESILAISAEHSAKYGAAAFAPGDRLPDVFPREMGPNTHTYLNEVVDSGLTSNMVGRFETAFAKAHDMKYCIGTPGCTQAMFATMLGMDFMPGDEVIVSAIADYGTVAGLLFRNLIPVFADTDPATALISHKTVEPLITNRTRAIICVHKLGLPCDMDPLLELAEKHHLIVIEDVCQAIMAQYKGRLAGTLGHVSCFSLDSEKTCGADIGGAILTNDTGIYNRIYNRAIARGAVTRKDFGREHIFRGFAARMPQCTAATALANFEILPDQIIRRQHSAALLDSLIANIPGITPYQVPAERAHTYWMYGFSINPTAFSCTPADFATELRAAGIANAGLGRYYLMPVALPFLASQAAQKEYPFSKPPASFNYNYSGDMTPNAKQFLDTWIRWVWTEKYTDEHIDYLATAIKQTADRYRR